MPKPDREKIAKEVDGAGDDGTHRLSDIDPEEVSLVNRGANRKKRFLIVKEDKTGDGTEGNDDKDDDAEGEGGDNADAGGETLSDVLKSQLDPYAAIVKAVTDAGDGELPEDVRTQASAVIEKLAGGFGLVLVAKDAGEGDDTGDGEEAGEGEGKGESRADVKKLDLGTGESYGDFRNKLNAALSEVKGNAIFGPFPTSDYGYLWIMDVYNDYMIVENEENWSYYKVPFSREADGTVVLDLDNTAKVERVETYVPVAKADGHWMQTMSSLFEKLNETLSGLQAGDAGEVDEDVLKSQAQNALKNIFGEAGIDDPVAFIKSMKDKVAKSADSPDLVKLVKELQTTVKGQAKQIRKFDGLLIGQSHVEEDEGGEGDGGGKPVSWPTDMAADVTKGKKKR